MDSSSDASLFLSITPCPPFPIFEYAGIDYITLSTNQTYQTEYAQVLKMLGNGRLEAQCFDGEKRLAHIRGKLRKKVSLC